MDKGKAPSTSEGHSFPLNTPPTSESETSETSVKLELFTEADIIWALKEHRRTHPQSKKVIDGRRLYASDEEASVEENFLDDSASS